MSTSEMVVEKVKGLTEPQAQAVLSFIQEISTSPSLSATELMRLSQAERHLILANQALQAETLYRENPEIIVQETDAPLSYE